MRKNAGNNILTLHTAHGLVYDDKSKADAIADVSEDIHYLTEHLSNDQTEKLVRKSYNIVKTTKLDILAITSNSLSEIKKEIKKNN